MKIYMSNIHDPSNFNVFASQCRSKVMANLDYEIIDGLTENMDMGQLVEFREEDYSGRHISYNKK